MKQRSKRTRSPHTRRTRGISAALALILIFGSLWYLPTVALGYTGEGKFYDDFILLRREGQ